MNYVTDTHALIWHLMSAKQLSAKARGCFEVAESGKAVVIVPAIVVLD